MSLEQLLKELKSSQLDKSPAYKQLQELSKLDADRLANLFKIKNTLKKLHKLLDQSPEPLPEKKAVITGLQHYQEELDKTDVHIRQRFGIDLEKELASLNLELTGQYPTLRAGLFTIKLNFERGKVQLWYGAEQEKLADCGLMVSEVKKKLEQVRKELGTDLDLDIFITKLKKAYSRTLENESRAVPITRVLPELAFLLQRESYYQDPRKENYRSYSRANFSYDLFRLGRSDLAQGLQLTIAVKQYTQRRQDFLWIPSNDRGEGAVYSHLQFKE
jgi:hypothetical protein